MKGFKRAREGIYISSFGCVQNGSRTRRECERVRKCVKGANDYFMIMGDAIVVT